MRRQSQRSDRVPRAGDVFGGERHAQRPRASARAAQPAPALGRPRQRAGAQQRLRRRSSAARVVRGELRRTGQHRASGSESAHKRKAPQHADRAQQQRTVASPADAAAPCATAVRVRALRKTAAAERPRTFIAAASRRVGDLLRPLVPYTAAGLPLICRRSPLGRAWQASFRRVSPACKRPRLSLRGAPMAARAAAPAAREAAPLEPCACAVLLQFDEPRQAQQINERALRSALTSIGVRPRCVMSCAVAWLLVAWHVQRRWTLGG